MDDAETNGPVQLTTELENGSDCDPAFDQVVVGEIPGRVDAVFSDPLGNHVNDHVPRIDVRP